jgi:hypothetical protein
MDKKFIKLSDMVDDTFTVEEAYGYQWKKWDAESRKMLTSERYEQGFSKIYDIVTDKGKLSLRQGQLAQMLEAGYSKGVANIIGVTFHVKSNGKSGMDIRYFINKAREQAPAATEEKKDDSSIDLSDIPF